MAENFPEAEEMTYRVLFRPSVYKDVRRLPRFVLDSIKAVLRALEENPFPPSSKKLEGSHDLYRIRVGRYRILYEVTKEVRIVSIIRIAHRSKVYRDL